MGATGARAATDASRGRAAKQLGGGEQRRAEPVLVVRAVQHRGQGMTAGGPVPCSEGHTGTELTSRMGRGRQWRRLSNVSAEESGMHLQRYSIHKNNKQNMIHL